ncbi:MAG: AAA family ATPase [Lachnospiraceae bacterium]|nr:AAA family ATPase [Lachnospiraceae bacterium]
MIKEKILLDDCLKKELPFVMDNTNPTAEDRERYIESAKDNGYKIIGYYFQSSVSECLERNNLREGKAKVPDVAVLGTYKKIEFLD